MEDKYFFIIIVLLILIIYYIHYSYSNKNLELFNNNNSLLEGDLLTLDPYQRCETLSPQKFMIRDIRTQLWLLPSQEFGFSKFLPGRFGISFLLSENPNEYLPLRILADPNEYLLSNYNGDKFIVQSNPNTQNFILEIYIYNGFNIIGYLNKSQNQLYIYIDDNGNITSVNNPDNASQVEMLFI